MGFRSWKYYLSILLVTAIYFGAGKLGLSLSFENQSISLIWLCSGISIAILLLFGYSLWPAILIGSFLTNITTSGATLSSLGIAAGNTVEALLGAYLLKRFANGREAFNRPEDIVRVVLFAFPVATLVSALIGVTTLTLSELAESRHFVFNTMCWWVGNFVGTLVLTPLIVLVKESGKEEWLRERRFELGIFLLALVTTSWAVFGGAFGPPNLSNGYICFLPLLWAPFRFDRKTAVISTTLLAGIAVWGTLSGYGPFAGGNNTESLFLLQGFVGTVALVSLMSASFVYQRQVASRALRDAHDNLEQIAHMRALELAKSEGRFRAVAETANDGIITADRRGDIVYFNPSAERIFGYTEEEMTRKSLTLLMPERFQKLHVRGISRFLATEQSNLIGKTVELVGRRKDGGEFPLELSLSTWKVNDEVYFTGVVRDISRRKQAEESKARLASIVESSDDAIIGIDLQYRINVWNPAAERLYGYSSREALGMPVSVLEPDLHNDAFRRSLEQLRWGEAVQYQAKRIRKDRSMVDVSISVSAVRDSLGQIVGYSKICRDVTTQKRIEEEKQNNELLRTQVESLMRQSQEILTLNELNDLLRSTNTVSEAYPIFPKYLKDLFPRSSGSLYVFNNSRNLLECIANWGDCPPREDILQPNECWGLRRGQVNFVPNPNEGIICQHLKPPIPADSICIPMTAQGETLGLLHLLGTPQDIQLRNEPRDGALEKYRIQFAEMVARQIASALMNIKLQETLRVQAIRDPLTGIFNRRYLEESLDRELHRAQRRKTKVGLIVLDLDHFKKFNDRYGHTAGDATLREVGAILQKGSRTEDVLCRYGGEEFVLLMMDCTVKDCVNRAEEIRERIKNLEIEHEGRKLASISISAGLALYPDHGRTPQEVFEAADQALYSAKHEGRDRVRVAPNSRLLDNRGKTLREP